MYQIPFDGNNTSGRFRSRIADKFSTEKMNSWTCCRHIRCSLGEDYLRAFQRFRPTIELLRPLHINLQQIELMVARESTTISCIVQNQACRSSPFVSPRWSCSVQISRFWRSTSSSCYTARLRKVCTCSRLQVSQYCVSNRAFLMLHSIIEFSATKNFESIVL